MTLLCLNLYFLWGYSGVVRGRTKTAMNPEDVKTVSKGAKLVEADPPEVARVLRAYANAAASILPFGFLGLFWVLLGADKVTALFVFGAFTFFRWLHSIVYLWGKQPFRTLAFVGAGIAAGAAMVFVVRGLLERMG